MAVNENVNKVVYGNSTLIDLTGDTVAPEALVSGYTAHDKSGASVTGTLELPSSSNPLPIESGGTNANSASGARTNLDVYSKSEVTNAISQSTVNVIAQLDPTYDAGNTYVIGVVFGPGYITYGSTDMYIMFDVPRRPNSNVTLTMTSCKLAIRGVGGYVDVFTSANTENISASGFTYTLSYLSNGQMQLYIKKSSTLTNVTNNTPILANGSISFRVS